MTRSYDTETIDASSDEGLRALVALTRAITAGEGGRTADQRAHIAKAAEHFAKALALLNPAGAVEQPITMKEAA